MSSAHPSPGSSREQYDLLLAQRNGWSLAYAQGYAQGKLDCIHRKAPGSYVLVGRDDYCSGFRAGYFAASRRPPEGTKAGANSTFAVQRTASSQGA